MLLKIATGDHLDSPLLDVATGRPFLTTISRSPYSPRRGSVSSQSTSSSSSSFPATWDHPVDRFADGTRIPVPGRHIWVLDAAGTVVAELVFGAVHPLALKFPGRAPVLGTFCCASLFASFETQTREGVLVAATRVDGFEWAATKSSMLLVDADGDPAMAYHPHARLDAARRPRPARLRRGAAFLELHAGVHALATEDLAELFVSFCFMELFRRGRFNLAPYAHTHDPRARRGAAGSKVRQLLGRLGRERGQAVAP